MDPLVITALIALPANLLTAYAALQARKSKSAAQSAHHHALSADQAVNHRVSGTTVSQDILDIRQEVRMMHRDLVWHLREDHGYGRRHSK